MIKRFTKKHATKLFIHPIMLLVITLGFNPISFAENVKQQTSIKIVVTIKPIYSLVAHLTDGIAEPTLLFRNLQSPHNYNLRPSERRLLAESDIIIWLGEELEPQLKKVINNKSNNVFTIATMQSENLKTLFKRGSHSHHEHHLKAESHHKTLTNDPHIWLSAYNAKQISSHIFKYLIAIDSKNIEKYETNLNKLLTKIDLTDQSIKAQLKNSKAPYIAFHDAFQYFDIEYQLNYVDSISLDDETTTSLKRLKKIKTQIKEKNVQCIIYQPQKPAIIDRLTKQTMIKTAELDPLGFNTSDNKNAWFSLMQLISENFLHCLTP